MPPQLPSPARSGPADVVDLLAGAGIAFVTFLAPIPGLLPCIGLIAAFGILLVLPLLLLGFVAAMLAAPVLLAARMVRRR